MGSAVMACLGATIPSKPPPYVRVLPGSLLAFNILAPSLLFALVALCVRRVLRTLGPVPATFAFAALWAGFDLLLSHASGAIGPWRSLDFQRMIRRDALPRAGHGPGGCLNG